MIKRRNYMAMTLMMMILLFLFMATQVVSDNKNTYSKNNYYSADQEKLNNSDSQEEELVIASLEDAEDSNNIVFVGTEKSDGAQVVEDWCYYSKNRICYLSSLTELTLTQLPQISLVVIDPDYVKTSDLTKIQQIAEEGALVLFYRMPEEKSLSSSETYRDLFGIREIVAEETELTGAKLFAGFLLGGERIYQEDEEEEEEKDMQDLDLTIPWYQVDTGTQTYMVGLVDESQGEVENEELPPIIWRTNHGEGFVYSVNGDYFSGVTGMGILTGILSQQTYYLYPVVNAQNISVVDFPELANENQDEINEIYSRNQNQLGSDVLLPSLISFISRCDKKATAYLMPQADYSDENQPQTGELDLYLQQLYHNEMEIGQSLVLYGDTDLETKLQVDSQFYEANLSNYQMNSAYTIDLDSLSPLLEESWASNLHTLVVGPSQEEEETNTQTDRATSQNAEESYRVVDYLSDNLTEQKITSDVANYTYSADLEMRSLQSVIGYSNILFDFGKVYWPEDATYHWENYSEDLFRVANTYWNPFSAFAQTTISESDARIRTFLHTDYSYEVDGTTIQAEVTSDDGTDQVDCYFVLRTHNESIKKIQGGDYTEIEDGAYLIHAKSSQLTIQMANNDTVNNLK